MMDIALAFLIGQAVQNLRLAQGTQRGYGEGLGLAAGEHGAAVGAGQDAGFAPDGANLGDLAAVGTDAFVQDAAAHDFLVQVVQGVGHLGVAAGEDIGKVLDGLGLHLLLTLLALGTVEGVEGPLGLIISILADGDGDILARHVEREVALGLADFRHDLLLEGNQLLDGLVREEDRIQHYILGYFLGAGFHHHDGVLGAGHVQADLGGGALLFIGHQDELAIYHAHMHGTRGARPGDIADAQGDGRAQHRGDFGGDVGIDGQGGSHYLHVVAHALGEERAQGTVDQAAGQGRLLGGTAFTLDEAAGNFTHGVLLFFKVYRQREEIDALAGGIGCADVYQHGGIAHAHQHGAVSLLGVVAEVERQRIARKVHRVRFVFHCFSLSSTSSSSRYGAPARVSITERLTGV